MGKKKALGKTEITNETPKRRPAATKNNVNAKSAAGKTKAALLKQAGQDAPEKKKRPVPCIRRHTDREFRREFPEVFDGLVKKAKAGGVGQTRLLLDIGKFGDEKAAKRRGAKSLSEMLLDELKRRQDEREAAIDDMDLGTAGAIAAEAISNDEGATSDGNAEKE